MIGICGEMCYEWHGINDIRSVNYNPNMCFEVTGKDANIYCRNINLNADLAKFVYIRYNIFGYSRIGQLFYSTCNENLDENHSCIFTVSPNDDMKEYIIDLSDHRDWRGLLSLIRFDPTGYDVREGESVMCELESIEICDRMPVYCSSLCYGRGQGINGWFYYTGNHGITYLEMVYDEKTKRWQCLDNPELWISESEQSSCLNMESVRRFVCQASGTYHIVCDIHPRTSNEKTVFTIKKGHRVVGQYKRDEVSIGNVTFDCCLERGEFLSFEYHNADVNPEVIALNISICKKDDR